MTHAAPSSAPDSAPDSPSSASTAPTPAPSLGRTAKVGSAWALAQSFASKFVSLGCQVALARLLLPAEMGIASKAISVHGLLLYLNPAIMSDVLIQRKSTIDEDARPAFRVAMLWSLVTGLVILASGPFFAKWYENPAVVGLLAVLALRPLGMAMATVSTARLRLDYRFGAISAWSIWITVGTSGASVLLAWLGWGPYAIVVPMVLALVWTGIIFSRLSPSPQVGAPPPGRARELFREWFTLCGGQYAHTVSLYIHYLVLAFFVSDTEVGFYYFAFNLSGQLNGIIVYNVSLVLQPIFAALKDEPERQMRAFLRVTTMISAVSVPLCVIQAALSGPGVRLVFGDKWDPAVSILAILSVAQAFAFTVGPATALFKSQGRYHAYLIWQVVQAVVLTPALILAAWLGTRMPEFENAASLLVSWVIVAQFAIGSPIAVWYAIQPYGGSLREAARPFTRPAIAAALSIGPLWLAAWWVPKSFGYDLLQLAVLPILGLILYPFALRLVDRHAYAILHENVVAVLRKIKR